MWLIETMIFVPHRIMVCQITIGVEILESVSFAASLRISVCLSLKRYSSCIGYIAIFLYLPLLSFVITSVKWDCLISYFAKMAAGWVHCDIMFAQWESWFSEISDKYSTEWYYWSKWNFPVPSLDYGMLPINLLKA